MEHNGISPELCERWSDAFHGDRANEIAANASVQSGFMNAATDCGALGRLPYTFSIDLKQGSITNQKSSGRCWLFAALNTFRFEVIRRYDLDDFELSQNYLFFYDKLERSNYYLLNMIATASEEPESRLFAFLNEDPMGDGGQWDMMANLVRKYGVVPKNVYDDGANSIASRNFNQYLASMLREFGAQLRDMVREGRDPEEIKNRREDMMSSVYRFLCIALGEPPKTFDLTMRSKDGKVYQEFGMTGCDFFRKYVGLDIDSYVSIINAPTEDKPYNRTYTIRYLGNVAEGAPVRYLNLPMEELKAAAIAQMKDGHPVWFGSDCSLFGVREHAVFDRKAAGVEKLVDHTYRFTKGDRLVYGDSAMNHAMVLLGVNLDRDGKPDRWRIENSWGKESGPNGGYYIASDSWFDECVYQIAVDRKYLSPEIRALLGQPMIELEPWDPMGTLAD